jgi:hypothetical protein
LSALLCAASMLIYDAFADGIMEQAVIVSAVTTLIAITAVLREFLFFMLLP